MLRIGIFVALLPLALPGCAVGQAVLANAPSAGHAVLVDADGETVGEVDVTALPTGGALVRADFTALPAGVHAFHAHETGACEPPSFASAGGHHAPDGRAHGALDPDGRHAGDLPNVHVPADGALTIELFVDRLSLDAVFDSDGSAFVVHAGADDYRTDPAGAAGDRIACGVIEPR